MKTIYLDHNATSMMEQGAKAALLLYSSSASDPQANFGNPSSIHWAGRRVKSVIDDSRDSIAEAFGITDPDALLFTSSATEATNTALKGVFFQALKDKKPFRLVTTAVEHEATLETAQFLKEMGAEVILLPVDGQGQLPEISFPPLPASTVGLASFMVANNETGVVFPWEQITLAAQAAGYLVHLDAVQAPGKLSGFALRNAPVDFASFSAHKIGGPKGVGALFVKKGLKITSLLHGGAQERKRRAGTLNVAGIASFGAAARALGARDLAATEELRRGLEARVLAEISGAQLQGAHSPRLVNTSNFLFEGIRGEGLTMGLDLDGFAISSGSACNSGSILPSHVLVAMGFDKSAAQSALRVSIGPETTAADLDSFVDSLKRVVDRIRARPPVR